MSHTAVEKKGGDDGCAVGGEGSGFRQRRSEPTSDSVDNTVGMASSDGLVIEGEWLGAETEDARWARRALFCPFQNPHPLASIPSPETSPPSIDNASCGSEDTQFYTPFESQSRHDEGFSGRFDKLDRTVQPRDLTAYPPVPQSWHNTSELNLNQIIAEGMNAVRWRHSQTPRQGTLFAPVSPNMFEESTTDRYLASPFCWPDSDTIWRLKHPDRGEYRRLEQDLQSFGWDDEMCGYRRTLAASWALASVVAWGPEGARLGGQMRDSECEDETSLSGRAASWLRSWME